MAMLKQDNRHIGGRLPRRPGDDRGAGAALGAPRPGSWASSPPTHRWSRPSATEMAYYRDHSHEGRDAASLAGAARSAARAALATSSGCEVDVETMMAAIRFRAYPDAAPALRPLRAARPAAGLRLQLGLLAAGGRSRGAASGEPARRRGHLGRGRRPQARPGDLRPALEIAGCGPAEAVHVGDTAEEDVAGARAAGIGRCCSTATAVARSPRWPGSCRFLKRWGRERVQPPAGAGAAAPPPARARPARRDPGGAAERRPGARAQALVGLATLLMVVILGSVVVAAFDPDLESLGSVLRPAGPARRQPRRGRVRSVAQARGRSAAALLGLRRPLVSPFKPAVLAYLAYIGCAILIAILLAPEQDDVTEELGYGESDVADVIVGFFVDRRRPRHRGAVLPRIPVRGHAKAAAVRRRVADLGRHLGALSLHRLGHLGRRLPARGVRRSCSPGCTSGPARSGPASRSTRSTTRSRSRSSRPDGPSKSSPSSRPPPGHVRMPPVNRFRALILAGGLALSLAVALPVAASAQEATACGRRRAPSVGRGRGRPGRRPGPAARARHAQDPSRRRQRRHGRRRQARQVVRPDEAVRRRRGDHGHPAAPGQGR